MWEFRTGNTFGAVAFTSYGAFWLSFWAFVQFFDEDVPKADAGHAVGLYLIAWGIFTTYMFVASLRTTAAIALVFLLLAVTFFVLGIGNAGAHTEHRQARRLDRHRDGGRGVVRLVRRGRRTRRSGAPCCRSGRCATDTGSRPREETHMATRRADASSSELEELLDVERFEPPEEFARAR